MKVFISHASTDSDLVRKVAGVLREAGLQVWDVTDVVLGQNWAAELARALEESDAMVVLLTPDSIRSPNVTYELGYALGNREYQGRVVSVVAAPAGQLPPQEIPWILKRFPMVHLSPGDEDETELRKLADALSRTAA